jgi:sugar/nucleoside kinase (ribokinase family)
MAASGHRRSGGQAGNEELLGALEGFEGKVARKVVVCLPDLFLDQIVTAPRWADLQKQLTSATLRGGGRIRTGGERLVVGGNAFNAARALARLGVPSRFAGLTSKAALDFARRETAGEAIDFSLVKVGGRASLTVAIEMGEERTNVQLNDPGSLDGLRLPDLGSEIGAALSSAAAVHIANWGQNIQAGTALVVEALRAAKSGGALTFLDPSDLWGREKDTLELIRAAPAHKDLDYVLVNEAELRELSRVLLLNAGGTSPCAHDDVEGQGREFTKRVEAGLALHTARHCQSWRKGRSEGAVNGRGEKPVRTTGAGDVWNAAFIAGTLAGLAPQVRLEFAQAAAHRFVTTVGPPPSLDEVRSALSAGLPAAPP